MKCPKCAHPQADGLLECARCGVIFARIPSRMAPPASPITRSSGDTEAGTGLVNFGIPTPPASVVAPAAMACLVLLALFLINKPGGRPVAGATQVSAEHGYAYTAPKGWLSLTAQNYEQLIKHNRGRLPAGVRADALKTNFDFFHIRLPDDASDFAPTIELAGVNHGGQPGPELTEDERSRLTESLAKQMRAIWPSYRLHSSRVIDVDGIAALELAGSAKVRLVTKPAEPVYGVPSALGSRTFLGQTPQVTREIELKTVQTFIPTQRYGIHLTCKFLLEDPHDTLSTCRQVVDSFRVTARPARLGPIARVAINVALAGALALLLFTIARRVVRR